MKKQNGITLISLIITIIIMLILAGVSLSMVMGDGSILEQTNAAVDNTKSAEVQEYVNLAVANNKAAKYSGERVKSKETILTEMVTEGMITEAEKNTALTETGLTINGTAIDFTELDSSYTDAINAGAVEGERVNFIVGREYKGTDSNGRTCTIKLESNGDFICKRVSTDGSSGESKFAAGEYTLTNGVITHSAPVQYLAGTKASTFTVSNGGNTVTDNNGIVYTIQ